MRRVTLGVKPVLAAATVVAGLTAGIAFAAPHLGLFGTTEVAGDSVTRSPHVSAMQPVPTATPLSPVASRPGKAAPAEARTPAASSSSRPTARPTPAPTSPSGPNRPGSPTPGGPNGFAIEGSVNGVLYPGGTADLRVTMRNPYGFPIEVVTATVFIGDASDCSAQHLWIDGKRPVDGAVTLSASQRIPARGVVDVSVPAQLRNAAGDECRNARFPLSYSGKAIKA